MEWYDGLIRPPIYGDQAADSRRTEFDVRNTVPVRHGVHPDIVFIGDSITQLWETNVYFHRYGLIINRGIGGDIIPIIRERFAADVVQLRPRCCVLQGGINSLWQLAGELPGGEEERRRETERILAGMLESHRAIIDTARREGIPLCVCAVLPCGEDWNRQIMPDKDWHYINQLILRYNEQLRPCCDGVHAVYADIHAAVTDGIGCSMLEDLSIDGIHPYSAGYDRIAEAVCPVLDRLLGPGSEKDSSTAEKV